MARKLSVHLAVRRYDRRDNGRAGRDLPPSIIESAAALQQLALSRAYVSPIAGESNLLVDERATSANLVRFVDAAATQLSAGDSLVISFCGYGVLPSHLGAGAVRGWMLWDRVVPLPAIVECLAQFSPRVRIAVISMSCFAGIDAGAMRTKRNGPNIVHLSACGPDQQLDVSSTFGVDLADAVRRGVSSFREIALSMKNGRSAPCATFLRPRSRDYERSGPFGAE